MSDIITIYYTLLTILKNPEMKTKNCKIKKISTAFHTYIAYYRVNC